MESLQYWVWLSGLFPLGSDKPRRLWEHFSHPEAIYHASEQELKESKILTTKDLRTLRIKDLSGAKAILKSCKKYGIGIVTIDQPSYPDTLRQIYRPPVVLYYQGDLSCVQDTPMLAVVGTREASEYGMRLTGNLCYELSRAGMVIISGCAMGIDSYAHMGALKAGGRTVAVLGCGIDVNYPAANRKLKKAILKKGLLLSELPPGTRPYPRVFPIRNRIMAGLAQGVMVTEAPLHSGALITAEYATEQNKELFCVPPHDIYADNFKGVADYLRDGAIPVCSAKDVLPPYMDRFGDQLDDTIPTPRYVVREGEEPPLPPVKRKNPFRRKKDTKQIKTKSTNQDQGAQKPSAAQMPLPDLSGLSAWQQQVYAVLGDTPLPFDEITARLSLGVSEVSTVLTELEILGLVDAHAGKRYAKSAHSS